VKKLNRLVEILKSAPNNIYIQPHNVPDPDAISSCFGIHYLLKEKGIKSQICYEHSIEKANSLKMLDIFGIDMKLAKNIKNLDCKDYIILIDVQTGNSNITNLIGKKVAVIDHHEYTENKDYLFEDIRPHVGACASIITEYYYENNIQIPTNVATALLYGIMMDTDNLTRCASKIDIKMFYWLYEKANMKFIKELKLNEIERKDLDAYAMALKQVEVYEYLGFASIKNCNDSLLGTISDMVTTISGVTVAISYSIRNDGVKFSIRSGNEKINASNLIKYILEEVGFGGGHTEMAGGFIPKENLKFFNNKEIDTYVKHRSISYIEQL
jgi:nanoRNase/pAp phosphatase (c-di-AMP/oligoRNAs hydrolase)